MNKRERRRQKRAAALGPLQELVEGSEREVAGVRLERLGCGHEVPAGLPRQTHTPGKIYRHCSVCPKPPALMEDKA